MGCSREADALGSPRNLKYPGEPHMSTLRDQRSRSWVVLAIPLLALAPTVCGQNPKLEPIDVEGQPLAANVTRLLQALDMFGSPLPKEQTAALQEAAKNRDAKK